MLLLIRILLLGTSLLFPLIILLDKRIRSRPRTVITYLLTFYGSFALLGWLVVRFRFGILPMALLLSPLLLLILFIKHWIRRKNKGIGNAS